MGIHAEESAGSPPERPESYDTWAVGEPHQADDASSSKERIARMARFASVTVGSAFSY